MRLGQCRFCSADLGVAQKTDRRADGSGVTTFHVACNDCLTPVPGHPHQRELDEAAAKAALPEPRRGPPPASGATYGPAGLADSFGRLEGRLAALEAVEARVARLEAAAEQTSRRGGK